MTHLEVANDEQAEATSDRRPTLPEQLTQPRPGLRVLIADDNKDAADTLAMLLEFQGYEVQVVYDGRAALTAAQAFQPDVALLDIGMPELDGYEVARAFRKEPWGKGLRLVAITGWGQDNDRRRAQAAGFDTHLTKPVDPQRLEELLASYQHAR